MTPEQKARQRIDQQLEQAGWAVQDYADLNLSAGLGVAVREFPLKVGAADYMLYVDCRAAGVVEAKPEGHTLTGVETQSGKYLDGLRDQVPPEDGRPRGCGLFGARQVRRLKRRLR